MQPNFEVPQHLLVEALCSCRRPLEPSGDRVTGMTRDPGGCRNAHALDSQACYLVELPRSAAKSTVRCPRVRADRSAAYFAAIPLPSTRRRGKPAVAHDVDAGLSKVVAPRLAARSLVDRPHRSSVAGKLGLRPINSERRQHREIKDLRVLLVPTGKRISRLRSRHGRGQTPLHHAPFSSSSCSPTLGARTIRAMCRRRADLVIENVALRQQVAALKKERPRPPVDDADRAFWAALRQSWPGWASRLVIVNADTVARWNRDRFRRYWVKISRRRYPGRPRVDREIRRLIRTMAQDGWGAPRIHAELTKLGFIVSEMTVSRYLPRRPAEPDQVKRWVAFA